VTRHLRLLAHGIDYTPHSAAEGSRASALVDWLAARGHCLSVVSTSRDNGRRRSWGAAKETLIAAAHSFRPDLIAALTPSASSATAVIGAARAAGVPAWLHLEEAAPPLGVEGDFTCVSFAALDAEEQLARRGVAEREALPLAPWVDTRAIAPPDAPGPLRAAFTRAADDIVALYVGSCADERVARILIEAARAVPTRGAVLFVAAVKGPAARLLAAAQAELPRLRLLRLPLPNELGDLLGAADIHLLPMKADADEPLLPARLASLLASGRPIVASLPATGLPRGLGHAVVMSPPTGPAFAAAIVDLAARPAERLSRGLAARRAAEDYFAKERVLRRLERRLVALAERRAA